MPSQIVKECSKCIKDHNMTIAFAESATAGRLAAEFALTEYSGNILKGGLVCYDARIKEDILGIEPGLIVQFTPESHEVTKAMAINLQTFIKSDIQVAVTGLTTPGGSENEHKPVGTMFIHVLILGHSIAVRELLDGSPEQMVLKTVDLAAQTIINELHQSAVRSS